MSLCQNKLIFSGKDIQRLWQLVVTVIVVGVLCDLNFLIRKLLVLCVQCDEVMWAEGRKDWESKGLTELTRNKLNSRCWQGFIWPCWQLLFLKWVSDFWLCSFMSLYPFLPIFFRPSSSTYYIKNNGWLSYKSKESVGRQAGRQASRQ